MIPAARILGIYGTASFALVIVESLEKLPSSFAVDAGTHFGGVGTSNGVCSLTTLCDTLSRDNILQKIGLANQPVLALFTRFYGWLAV